MSFIGGKMQKFTIPITVLLMLALGLGVIGCGGDEDSPVTTPTYAPSATPISTSTSTPIPVPTDEDMIQKLVDEQIAAMNALDWETIYNQRSPSYRSRVTLQELADFVEVAYAEFMPIVESGEGELKFENRKIRIEGNYAYVTADLVLNGTVLVAYTDDSPDIWQQIDGTWYNLETIPFFPGYDASELPD